MVRELNMDTQRQNFWKEAIKKEAYVRLAWHQKYRDNVSEDDQTQATEQQRTRSKRFQDMVPKPPTRSLTLPVLSYPKRRQPKLEVVAPTTEVVDPNLLLVEMRPVSPGIRKMLYHGFTKEGKGRYQYLQARTIKKPEEKYEFPLTTSWEYGWHLDDVVKDFWAPQFGRSRIVRDTFYRRNGILYEPITA
uniref:Protein ATP6V1FNB-like n=1 Tax=Ciona intestinalis TaxID=7719 RepID=F6QNH2_CIOIN|nr:protein ATP6V1FNB-like [Ciona intestinalis]|eukprot:XP_002124916.1 protein ATP6V1FNB-like [Ciona intestinalis]